MINKLVNIARERDIPSSVYFHAKEDNATFAILNGSLLEIDGDDKFATELNLAVAFDFVSNAVIIPEGFLNKIRTKIVSKGNYCLQLAYTIVEKDSENNNIGFYYVVGDKSRCHNGVPGLCYYSFNVDCEQNIERLRALRSFKDGKHTITKKKTVGFFNCEESLNKAVEWNKDRLAELLSLAKKHWVSCAHFYVDGVIAEVEGEKFTLSDGVDGLYREDIMRFLEGYVTDYEVNWNKRSNEPVLSNNDKHFRSVGVARKGTIFYVDSNDKVNYYHEDGDLRYTFNILLSDLKCKYEKYIESLGSRSSDERQSIEIKSLWGAGELIGYRIKDGDKSYDLSAEVALKYGLDAKSDLIQMKRIKSGLWISNSEYHTRKLVDDISGKSNKVQELLNKICGGVY